MKIRITAIILLIIGISYFLYRAYSADSIDMQDAVIDLAFSSGLSFLIWFVPKMYNRWDKFVDRKV